MKFTGKTVFVQDGNVDRAMRKFKKKITDMNIIQEVRDRQQFVKPTTKRKIAQNQAKRRWLKHLRSQQLPPKLF